MLYCLSKSEKSFLLFKDRSLIAIGYPLIFLAVFLFSISTTHAQLIKNLDRQTEEELSEDRTEEPTEFMQTVSNTTSYISFAIPAALIAKGMLSHDKITVSRGWYIIKTIGVATAITYVLKYTVNRKRPFSTDPSVIQASSGGGPSFPSGHTAAAFATATSLSFAYPKWYVIIPSYLWAGTVAYSRLYLGVHYPTDVWAGAVVGTGSAFLSYKLNNWLHKNKKETKLLPVFRP